MSAPAPAALNDILCVADVAALLDCESETVCDNARNRKLPGVKFGRSWIFPKEALLKVINQQALRHLEEKPAPLAIARAPRGKRLPPPLPEPF